MGYPAAAATQIISGHICLGATTQSPWNEESPMWPLMFEWPQNEVLKACLWEAWFPCRIHVSRTILGVDLLSED